MLQLGWRFNPDAPPRPGPSPLPQQRATARRAAGTQVRRAVARHGHAGRPYDTASRLAAAVHTGLLEAVSGGQVVVSAPPLPTHAAARAPTVRRQLAPALSRSHSLPAAAPTRRAGPLAARP